MIEGRQRIAIIGAGISGLGAAYLLNPHHDITVYENNDYAGGHARTLTLNYNGKTLAVDTGFIVFNHKNYPNLVTLFDKLGVASHKTSMSFGLKTEDGSLEWGAENINALFAQRRNLFRPKFYRFLLDVFKFNSQAVREANRHPSMTLHDLITKLGLSDWFARYYILPMGGAIWSTPVETMLGFPAKFFVNFFDDHGLLSVQGQPQWYAVTGGSKIYVEKLITSFKNRIRLGCGVTRVSRQNNKAQIIDSRGEMLEYDHVVFACHAPEVLPLLSDATENEKSIFSNFQHQKNTAILHKHSAVMPRHRACWSSWVYHAKNNEGSEPIAVTYWMNALQGIDNQYPLFVTLNPPHTIPPEDIFDRHDFYHPIYSPQSVSAQPKIAALQGTKNTWYCGAYNRFGFHEDGLSSAVAMTARMGINESWH